MKESWFNFFQFLLSFIVLKKLLKQQERKPGKIDIGEEIKRNTRTRNRSRRTKKKNVNGHILCVKLFQKKGNIYVVICVNHLGSCHLHGLVHRLSQII